MRERYRFEIDPVLEMIDRSGVEGFLFDYDDTFCASAKMIGSIMRTYSRVVGEKLGVDPNVVFGILEKHNNKYYSSLFVNPVRWIAAGDGVSVELTGSKRTLKPELDILMSIFHSVPELFPGVKSLLYQLSRCGKKVGIVTHAPLDWTILKLERHGIIGYIDHLQLADVNKHKSIEDWRFGVVGLGIQPCQVIGTGDNINGDVVPMLELGMKGVLALPNSWSVHRAILPKEAVSIDRIGDYFDGVERVLAGKI